MITTPGHGDGPTSPFFNVQTKKGGGKERRGREEKGGGGGLGDRTALR